MKPANTRPAAPVEGLETLSVEMKRDYAFMIADPDGDYVTRSQAEAIIAAERAKIALAETTMIEMHQALNKREADNASLTARVKELENINANLMGDDEDKPRYTTKRLKQEIARETKALETQLAAAKKALEAIEDHSTRCETLSSHSSTAVAYLKDIQQEARAALEGKP